MNETRRQAGSLHDRERFLSGTVTNSTNSTRSTPTTTTPRLYAITHSALLSRLASRASCLLQFPPRVSTLRRGEEFRRRNRKIGRNIPSSTISSSWITIFVQQICSLGCIISNGVTVRSEDRKNSIKIGKFERINFLEIRKIFRKVSDENARRQSSLFVEGI